MGGKATLMEQGFWTVSFERCAKEFLNGLIYEAAKGIVISGPFKGMQILEEIAWEDGNLGPKVLGTYEQDLHGFFEVQIERLKQLDRPPRILNIGCGEGYYAIGMARIFPHAEIIAVDESDNALDLARKTMEANGVTNIKLTKDCPYQFEPDLVICDCEGGEMVYMDLAVFPGLKNAAIIVECHDLPDRPVTETLDNRFKETHGFYFITEGARNPNTFDILIRFPSMVRWLAVSESRPCRMHWVVLLPPELDGNA